MLLITGYRPNSAFGQKSNLGDEILGCRAVQAANREIAESEHRDSKSVRSNTGCTISCRTILLTAYWIIRYITCYITNVRKKKNKYFPCENVLKHLLNHMLIPMLYHVLYHVLEHV